MIHQHQRVLTEPTGVPRLSICLKVNNILEASANKKLKKCLRILHIRFKSYIILGMGRLSKNESEICKEWLATGVIDQIVCSGHDSLILNDLVDAAIRSNTGSVIFMSIDEFQHGPAHTLKFIVENLGIPDQSNLSVDARFWFIGQQKLRDIPKLQYPGEWNQGVRFAHAGCIENLNGNDKVIASIPTIGKDAHQLFVTEAGLNRLGGWEKFKANNITLGGLGAKEFDEVLVLTTKECLSDNKQFDSEGKILAITPLEKKGESVVFDIWPASYIFHKISSHCNDNTTIKIPRQILIGRRCPVVLQPQPSEIDSLEAIFIMSNYNKESYLYAGLYGWVMQTHSNIKLEIVDDMSTDNSISKLKKFLEVMQLDCDLIRFRVNENKKWTYWIRNLIIFNNNHEQVVFFINDSDDVSSALRATLQLNVLISTGSNACLFNIVRVDSNYTPLPMSDGVERYGTASLAFKSKLIRYIGFFQNIKKNADTEFIRRIKYFLGKTACPWIKLPVMLQPFDGNNLTSDIYKFSDSNKKIIADIDRRDVHIKISDQQYKKLNLIDLPRNYDFPLSTMQEDYAVLGSDFLIDSYKGQDSIIVVLCNNDISRKYEFLQAGFTVIVKTNKGYWEMVNSDRVLIESTTNFIAELRKFLIRNSLRAYIISIQVADNYGLITNYGNNFISKRMAELLLLSKIKDDRFIMRSDGSWSDFEKSENKLDDVLELYSLLHTSVLFH